MATELKTYGDVLNKAARIMQRRGLAQFTYEDGLGRVCFIGAINAAVVGEASADIERGEFMDFGVVRDALYFDSDYGDIAIWNDTEGRTKKEVVNRLKLAAWVLDDVPLKGVTPAEHEDVL